MKQGLVGYINDEIAVHRIRPNSESPLVSMYVRRDRGSLFCALTAPRSHLYAPPIKRCQVYCPQLEKVSEAKMCAFTQDLFPPILTHRRCYHTIQKCPVEGAMAVEYVKVT